MLHGTYPRKNIYIHVPPNHTGHTYTEKIHCWWCSSEAQSVLEPLVFSRSVWQPRPAQLGAPGAPPTPRRAPRRSGLLGSLEGVLSSRDFLSHVPLPVPSVARVHPDVSPYLHPAGSPWGFPVPSRAARAEERLASRARGGARPPRRSRNRPR